MTTFHNGCIGAITHIRRHQRGYTLDMFYLKTAIRIGSHTDGRTRPKNIGTYQDLTLVIQYRSGHMRLSREKQTGHQHS